MHTLSQLRRLLPVAALAVPLGLQAEVYVSQSFDSDTIGNPPADAAIISTSQVTVGAGSGLIGTDNLADFNDSTGSAGYMEYNVGSSGLSQLYVQFDFMNPAPSGSGSGTQPMIFSVGPWNTATGIKLGANASRDFGIEIYQLGTSSTLKLRVNGSGVFTTTYDTSALLTARIWVNDDDTNALAYTRPDTNTAASLNPDSFVFYLSTDTGSGAATSLIGTADTGYSMYTTNSTGNATLGRVGFDSTTSTITHFLIDNVYIASSSVPEPSTYALFAGLGAFALLGIRRLRQR